MSSRTLHGLPIVRRLAGIAACAAVFALPAITGIAFAQGAPEAGAVGRPQGKTPAKAPDRPAGQEAAGRPVPGAAKHYWHDGGQRRELRIDSSQVADFGKGRKGASPSPLRPSRDTEKDAANLPAGVSPVFHDAAAPAGLRALPGGIIVTLKRAPAGNDAAARESEAHRQLASAGLQPLRAIGSDARRWLVASPAGLTSLEQANRLHESGDFEAVAPNWWRSRALK